MTPWSHPFSERASVFRFVTADPALEALVTPDTGSQAFELYLLSSQRKGVDLARRGPFLGKMIGDGKRRLQKVLRNAVRT
jgi:hypothetical protein